MTGIRSIARPRPRPGLVPGGAAFAGAALAAGPAFAEVPLETAYIFNTFSFLVHGILVMLMAAGFAMLEAGLVRAKNTTAQCLKNITLYSVAGIMFYVLGYDMLYGGASPYFGGFTLFWEAGAMPAADALEGGEYSAGSDWFFQMVFVATTASIVSGALAERTKLWSFFVFVVVLAALIYPIQGAWSWGGGWLAAIGFADFAGSTIVHSVGGWAALAGALVIGARKGKYGADGKVTPMPGANLPLATLGTFVLWFGWFGFNGGSQLAMGTMADVTAIGTIYINTNLAAAGGVVAAVILTQALYRKMDLTMALNGALGGLVAITAEPLAPSPGWAILVGAIGGVIVVLAVPALDRLKIDDVVGAIPVHLLAGIWGTLAVPFSNAGASFGAQITGILAVGVFAFVTSLVVWYGIKLAMGVRAGEEAEMQGLDTAECGIEAYPEFGAGSQRV